MLFVVFGATLDLGYETRQIFRSCGFDVVHKYNYVSDDALVEKSNYTDVPKDSEYAKWYDDKIYIEKDELDNLDFSYQLDGVYVGFNQQQIMDAVRGIKDAILTVGASGIDLLVQLKKAYGDYITIINIFEDIQTVIASAADVSASEKETRIRANSKMQQLYIDNLSVFDALVVYAGENSVYNMESLIKQYTSIIEIRRRLEKMLNNRKYVELPYSGLSPYIFVSYAHDDKNRVYPLLYSLQRNSYRLWYDDGIHAGANWRMVLEEKIENAEALILFHSKKSAASDFVESEISWALQCNKPIFVVMLDESPFRRGYNMTLPKKQHVSADAVDFEARITECLPPNTKQQ